MTSGRKITRRVLLSLGGTTLLAGSALAVNFLSLYGSSGISTVGRLDFRQKLRIPELLTGEREGGGRRHFDLTVRTGRTELLPGKKTPTWGVNGSYLGPTLRARRGDEVSIAVRNKLPEATTVHWHGMHLPPAMDGGPHQMIEPGRTWYPRWTVTQPASTLWYHPHPHGSTGSHVYRGVAGMFLIDDPDADQVGLPRTYGVDDVPLILQDKNFHEDGTLDLSERTLREAFVGMTPTGVLGDTILVNGVYAPYFGVTTRLVRFRVLNASNARVYDIGMSDERAFHLVGTDNGLLTRPVPLHRLLIAPGERYEIVVPFKAGEEVVMRSFPPRLHIGFPGNRLSGGDDTFDLLSLRAEPVLAGPGDLPSRLNGAPASASLDSSGASRTRRITMVGTALNYRSMDMNRIDEVVPAGATEVWEIEKGDESVHTFHLHGATFHILDVHGRKPADHERGPKDTVFLPGLGVVRLLVRFERYTDTSVPYMYHCHILRHEDSGMMGQFLVVEPGTEKSVPRTLTGSPHHPGAPHPH